ncbi:hypothetical protein VC566_13780 [Citrobacter freundii]|nr:hypothetical protein [Citrobacter freundii]
MKALNKRARLVSSARISEIANGANLIMGEKEWLANTAIYLANELKTATKAFQSTGFSLLEAEEKLEAAEKRIAELRDWNAGLAQESFTYQQRVAELEALAVNLPKRSVGEVMHMSGFSRDYAEGWCAGNDNAIHEIRAAGIGVKGE